MPLLLRRRLCHHQLKLAFQRVSLGARVSLAALGSETVRTTACHQTGQGAGREGGTSACRPRFQSKVAQPVVIIL